MAKVKGDYKAEYARRIAGGAAGITLSQAGGNPKPREAVLSAKRPPKRVEDERMQLAFRVLGPERILRAAAEAVRG